jgi:hypothetical protein
MLLLLFVFIIITAIKTKMNNIKINLREMGSSGVGWIDLAQDRDLWMGLVITVMNLRVS